MNKLIKNQIDTYLATYNSAKELPIPPLGWIKYIRNALGMTTQQLAKRLKVNRRRVVKIEEAEIQDAITLKTLKEVAKAMNCILIYAIVPKTSINQILEEQARKFVKQHLTEIAHHMALESQSVKDKKAIEAQIEDLVEEYLAKPRVFWDD